MPLIVGVITRTKNRLVLLRRAIESVLTQSHEDWVQVIINDGGDPTEIETLVASYASQAQGRIRIIHHAHSKGMEAASNAGIRSIIDDVDCLIIHDDDDSWAPDFLKIATSELTEIRAKLPNVMGVVAQANCVYEEIQGPRVTITDIEPFLPWVNHGLVSFDAMLHQCQFAPIQFLYDKSVIAEIGAYRESLPVLGDWEFNLRFIRRYDIWIIPQYLAFYHHRRSSHGHYSNTVIGAKDTHDLYRQLLKNEWLREDLKNGVLGLGFLTNQRANIEHLIQQDFLAHKKLDLLDTRATHRLPPLKTARLLLASGRPSHYVQRFVYFLRKNGLRAALARTRFWIQIKSGQFTP